MPRLVANRPFRYASRQLGADEEFEADSKDMLVLTATTNPLARAVSSGAEQPDLLVEKQKSKRYGRRDMRAED